MPRGRVVMDENPGMDAGQAAGPDEGWLAERARAGGEIGRPGGH